MLDQRLVGVAAEDNADSCRVGVEIEVLKGVEHVEQTACEFDGLGGGQGGAGAGAVDVAANRRDGSDPAEFGEDFRVANIACVEDVGDSCKGWEKLWTKQAVGVGDDADEHARGLYPC